MRDMEFTVEQQGAPLVAGVWVAASSRNMIALHVDMTSKYTELCMGGDEHLMFSANERSIHLHPDEDRERCTLIRLHGMPRGFEMFASSSGRYTINVVYMRQPRTWRQRLSDIWENLVNGVNRLKERNTPCHP